MNFNKLSNRQILIRFAIPQMIGLIFNSAYFIVDGIFIGQRLGAQSLASAGVAVPVVEIMIALSMLISVGAGVSVSNSIGKNDKEEANKIFNIANSFTLYFAIAIAILGNIFILPLSRMMGATDLLLNETVVYLRYFLTASPFLVFSFTLSTFVRNDGQPKRAMWALIVGAMTNIILDYVLMYPLNMGMAGAALATALGPIFSVIILLPHFINKENTLHFKKTKMRISYIKNIFISGISAFITNFSIGFITLVYNIAIIQNNLGEEGLSSYIVIGYISLIGLTSFLGTSQGIQPALSFFKGQDDTKRIKSLINQSLVLNLILGSLFYFIIVVVGYQIISVFINEPALILSTHKIAIIYFLNLPLAAINIVIATCLQSIGKQKESTILSLLRTTLPLLFFIIVLPQLWGAMGLWLAMSASECVTLIPSILILRKNI